MKLRSLADLKADFDALRIQDWNKPALELCAVKVASEPRLADRAAFDTVKTALTAPDAQGWARLRSDRFASGDGAFPKFEEAGPPLAAEWAESPEISVHLRGAAEGVGLTLWRYVERKANREDKLETEVATLRQIVKILRHGAPTSPADKALAEKQAILVYHVFWGASDDEPSDIRRLFSRFVGFDLDNRVIDSRDRD